VRSASSSQPEKRLADLEAEIEREIERELDECPTSVWN
jgi:hypothetical protein